MVDRVLNKNRPSGLFTGRLVIKRSRFPLWKPAWTKVWRCRPGCLWPYVDMGQSSEWCYSTGGCDNASQALRRPQTSMPFFAVSDIMWRPPAGNQPTVHLCLCVRRGAFTLTAPPAGNSLSGHLDVSWRVQGRSWDADCVKVFKVEIRVDVSTAACFL